MNRISLLAGLLFIAGSVFAQSAFMNRFSDDYAAIERYDLLNARLSDTLNTMLQPMPQKDVVRFLEDYLSTHQEALNEKEAWEIRQILSKNGEWTAGGEGALASK